MKLRTIGAVLAGAAMIGATVAGAAAAADAPAKSWFIDPATGQPNVTVVVGAQANASDVVSASLIAAAVGNMATVEETASTTKTASVKWEKVGEYMYPDNYYPMYAEYNTSYCTAGKYPATYWVDFELYSNMYWETAENYWPHKDYDTYVQIAMPTDVRNPGGTGALVAKGLNTLWFSNSNKEWDSKNRVYYFGVQGATGNVRRYYIVNNNNQHPDTRGSSAILTDGGANPTTLILRDEEKGGQAMMYAGGSYDDGDGAWDFNTYSLFSTAAWVNVIDAGTVNYIYDPTDDCDYIFGGTGTAMEAHEEIQLIVGDKYESDPGPNGIADFLGDYGSASGIVYRTAEIRYPLLENGQNICGITKCWGMVDFETARSGYLNEIKFLGKMYRPMFSGATWTNTVDGTEYYMGGYFMYGKPFAEKEKIMKVGDVYSYHGWTVTLNDVNIYENKAYITVAGPALTAPFNFIMVMDSLGACGPCCPDCATYGGNGAFTSNPTKRNEYDPYVKYTTVTKEKSGYTYDFFRYVNFMLDGIKTFVGADGTYLAEFNLYAIEDYGYLEDKGCCDPFVTTPNDYALKITGGWRRVVIDGEDPVVVTPWEFSDPAVTYTIADAYVLWEPAPRCAPTGYCPDANFDTLELQLCDNINIPNCETTYTVNGPENYFTVEVVDVDFGRYNDAVETFPDSTRSDNIPLSIYKDPEDQTGYTPYDLDDATYMTNPLYTGQTVKAQADKDGVYLRLNMSTAGDTIKYTANVKIDPVELIKLDIEVNTATNTKNLVLVGGPVYNSIVKDLVDMGASTVDWATSAGEWEWIADPMAKGYDVLIVAGANREETRMAAEDLIAILN